MSLEEIKRFNKDVARAQKLLQSLQQAGSDVDNILGIAKSCGFNISMEDVVKAKQSITSVDAPEGSRALVGAVVGAAFVV